VSVCVCVGACVCVCVCVCVGVVFGAKQASTEAYLRFVIENIIAF